MHRKLTAHSSLDTLRKEAKRWLKALRAHEAGALERLRRAYPGAPAEPNLRDVQHALAREHGLESWVVLKGELSAIALDDSGHDRLLAEFLEHSCLHYGIRPITAQWDRHYRDEPSRWHYAARILARNPDLARNNIHAAAVSGDVAEVARILNERPAAAREKGGSQGWEPLLYVCYGRLPLPEASANAVGIARLLLDAGANVNAWLGPQDNMFRPITGAIGGGEFSQPPHPEAVALAELLIERGADPYDAQTLYNTSLEGEDVFWLDFLYERSARRNETSKWRTEWSPSGVLDYLLDNAVSRSALHRARWLLAHGASANAVHAHSKRKVHTEARLLGFTEMAALLKEAGAVPEELSGSEEFLAACMRGDLDTVSRLARGHAEYLEDATPLIQCAERDLLEVATCLLDLGMSPEVASDTNFRALHAAASTGSVRVGRLLIERGAQIDPQETRFNATPLGWAEFYGRPGMVALLGPLSRSPKSLVRAGCLDRLRELFGTDASLARVTDENGSLFVYLPDDEEKAMPIAELLLEHGADPLVRNKEGLDATAVLEKGGLDTVAERLRSRSRARAASGATRGT